MARLKQGTVLISSVVLSIFVGQPLVAADVIPQTLHKPAQIELELNRQGSLHGYVVNRQGKPQPNLKVAVSSQRKLVTSAKTDANGRFEAKQLRGGEYFLAVSGAAHPVRVWAAGTAPVSVKDRAMLVVGDTVRGQGCSDGCGGCDSCCPPACESIVPAGHFDGFLLRALRNPWIVGGATAAAIAIPLALDDDDAS